jgi:NAD(P)-dependent dehydrogenase (short-subunit alcohol dehydrogenase family)
VGAADPYDTARMTENTMIHTGFGAESTMWDVVGGVDLSGRRALVTGASSGIGIETARALAATGAEVTLAVRDAAAGERTAVDIRGTTGNQAVRVGQLDLADLDSVREFVAAWAGPLHLLINNAGVMALPTRELTDRGWELQFATNHIGHFALTAGLHDALAGGAHSGVEARIVSLSSRGHLRSPVVFDDLHFDRRPYDPWLAYGQSKTANVLLAVEAHRRWSSEGITANAVHPGAIFETNLSRHMSPDVLERVWSQVRQRQERSGAFGFKTPEQGAATSVLIATSHQLDGIGGRYFEDCNQARLLPADFSPETASGVAPYALDPENAARLWELSERLIANTR